MTSNAGFVNTDGPPFLDSLFNGKENFPNDFKESNNLKPETDTGEDETCNSSLEMPDDNVAGNADDNWDDADDDDYDEEACNNPVVKFIMTIQDKVKELHKFLSDSANGYLYFATFCFLYAAYFIAAMVYEFGDEGSVRLLVCTILGVIILARHQIQEKLEDLYYRIVGEAGMSPTMAKKFNFYRRIARWGGYLALVGVAIGVLIDEAVKDGENLRAVPGLLLMVLLSMMISRNPHMINWHTFIWSIGLQFIFAICVLRLDFGKDAMDWLQDRIDEFFSCTEPAFQISFGYRYKSMGLTFNSLPRAFLLSAALTLLYYLGVMQVLVNALGKFFSFVMDASYVEALSVAGGIFVDGPLAVLALRPYLYSQSKSQLFTIIASTFASLGGTTVAIVTGLGIPLKHVLSAMLISAPATFTICKLVMPQSKRKDKEKHSDTVIREEEAHANVIDAFQTGAVLALPVVGNIIAIVFAFLSGIDWMNNTLEWFGQRIGKHGFTMDYVFSYMFYPVALSMGIKPDECRVSGEFIGIKLISSSVVAFIRLNPYIINRRIYDEYMRSTNYTGEVYEVGGDLILGNVTVLRDGYITERTETILTYSLCGLSSFLSMALTLASFYALIPRRREWISKNALLAMLAGNLANFMTGSFAGLFYESLE